MTVDFYDAFDKPKGTIERPTLHLVDAPRRDGLHPYAAAAIAGEIKRLDDLPRPWSPNSYWDQTTFDVACNLLELANSAWSGYSRSDAEGDLYAHAPADARWGAREHETKWNSALDRVGAQGRPEPAPGERWEPPVVTVLGEGGDSGDDPLARFNLINWRQLRDEEDKGEDWLVEPILGAGRMVALYSAPKAGKSLLVLEVVAALALGLPTLGQPARESIKVLYIDFENDPRGDIKPRLEDMGHDLANLEGCLYVSTFPSLARLDTPQGGYELTWLAEHLGASLVVIDTVSRTVGGEENDNNTWLNFYRNTGVPLKRANIACLRLDHSGKDSERGMRGGSAKYGDLDAAWRLSAPSETVIELSCTHHRMMLPTKELAVVRRTDPLRHEVSGDPFAVVIDAKESKLIADLERLEIPIEWGRDRARRALSEHGIKVENTLLGRVIKARKWAQNNVLTDLSRTGRGQVRTADPVAACPAPPVRGRTADRSEPVRGGQDSDESEEPSKPLFHVGCKGCHKSIHRDTTTSGLCLSCAVAAGLTSPNGAPA